MLLILLCLLNYSGDDRTTTPSQPPQESPSTSSSSQPNINPCAACKALRRKCAEDCLFAPYFPPERMDRFMSVHKTFGASNVRKILQEVEPEERLATVESLVYEANARQNDLVYGSVATVYLLQQQLRHVEAAIANSAHYLSTLPPLPPQIQYQDHNQNHQIQNHNHQIQIQGDLQHRQPPPPQNQNGDYFGAPFYPADLQQQPQLQHQNPSDEAYEDFGDFPAGGDYDYYFGGGDDDTPFL